ncbi:toxin Fic [Bifidobacterium margollesii]|uniref:protein adenylyltransferase n=1 Tax=Bifidobacterium margollesii TaxID=2020964 RepID=A0A2N5J7V8_9BIFI|nr:Fic family protein [Bifidobacterium margollesii]PLS30277.1 toxin Fic [Bifidobacterium margollesii]
MNDYGFVDPYIDPTTGLLRNKVGATTLDELKKAEGELVSIAAVKLIENPPRNRMADLNELREIHRRLFGAVYSWAGEIRTVEIRKLAEGSEYFLPSPMIPTGIEYSMNELRKDGYLKNLDKDEFLDRLVRNYDNYNYVHPFREGNGRTQRMLWTLVCHEAGYDIDWRLVSKQDNDEGSRLAAEQRDYSILRRAFDVAVKPCDPDEPILVEHANVGHLKPIAKLLPGGDVYVHAHTKSDGTEVAAHFRSRPSR